MNVDDVIVGRCETGGRFVVKKVFRFRTQPILFLEMAFLRSRPYIRNNEKKDGAPHADAQVGPSRRGHRNNFFLYRLAAGAVTLFSTETLFPHQCKQYQ